MLRHQQRKIGIFGLAAGIFVAVAIDGNNTIGVLIHDRALGVHTEGAYLIPILFGAVHNFAFVQFIGEMGKNGRGQFHPHAQIHAVGVGGDIKIPANGLHPLAAAAPYRNNALAAGVFAIGAGDAVAAFFRRHRSNRRIKEEGDLILQLFINILQYLVVNIGAQMPHRSIQKMQVILDANRFKTGTGGGIELGPFAAVGQVNFIDIPHQIQGLLFANILIQRTAKVIGNIVLAIGKSTGTAKTAHDRAGGAANAAFNLIAIDGAVAAMERMAGFQYGHPQFGRAAGQFVGGKNAAGARTDDNHIVIHSGSSAKNNG